MHASTGSTDVGETQAVLAAQPSVSGQRRTRHRSSTLAHIRVRRRDSVGAVIHEYRLVA